VGFGCLALSSRDYHDGCAPRCQLDDVEPRARGGEVAECVRQGLRGIAEDSSQASVLRGGALSHGRGGGTCSLDLEGARGREENEMGRQ